MRVPKLMLYMVVRLTSIASLALVFTAVTSCGQVDNVQSTIASTGGVGPECGYTVGGAASTLKLPAPTMTKAEWEAATAPVAIEHLIWGALCDAPISQEYQVLPDIVCVPTAQFDSVTNPVQSCTAQVACMGPSDCHYGQFSTCTGIQASYCVYPTVTKNSPCLVDSDCTAIPYGSCGPFNHCQVLFYPDGELGLPGSTCTYPEQPCTVDSDCSSAPQGACAKLVRSTRCSSNECLVDSDCGSGSRCYCDSTRSKECIPADCNADADCEPGQVCRLEETSCGHAVAYHCSTAADTCTSNLDCGSSCKFDGGYWRCIGQPCLF